MKIPQFLYVPRINTLAHEKLIIETRLGAYYQVLEFANLPKREEWLIDQMDNIPANTIHLHKKYPYLLLCLGVKSEVTTERLIKVGNIASDWYAQFWIKNQQHTTIDYTKFNVSHYAKHWLYADNILIDPTKVTLINLAIGVSIAFDYADAYFATFEDFEQNIADIQFFTGNRPSAEQVHEILIAAWNFLALTEQEEERQANNRY